MINIVRPPQSPASLQTQEIKDYLIELAAWKVDQALPKDQQTLSKPKPNPSYRNSDLIKIFDEYFFAKCYLTEEKFTSSYEMDIEHFHSKDFNAHPELHYEWSNLYPAGHDANMTKPRITPVGGYLDPCNPNDDVEKDIFYWLDYRGETCHFDPRDGTNIKAINTANLLNRIHNGHNLESKLKTGGLRKALFDKRDDVYKAIISWLSAKSNGNTDEEMKQAILLKRLLSRKSSFTMLIRSTTAVKQHIPTDFLD
jgi:hypothetical protein